MKLIFRWWKLAVSVSLALAIYSSVSRADENAPAAHAPTIHVDKLDPDADTRPFEAPGYKVNDRSARQKSEVPLPKERDATFATAGLTRDVKDWDALDRDVLYLRAKNLSLKDLKRRYPKIDPGSLTKLRETVGGKR
jgi:hypothetical protein